MIGRWWRGGGSERVAQVGPWALVCVWVGWALVRLLGLDRGFPLVPLVAYTPYMAAAAVLPIALALFLRRWAVALTGFVAGACLVAVVVSRALPDPGADDHRGPTLRVLSANIHRGKADLGELMDLVRVDRPDVLNVQELTPSAKAKLRRLGVERLLPHHDLPVYSGDASNVYRRIAGSGIYSRFPLRALRPGSYGFRMPRAMLRVPGGPRVEVVCVHPFPPNRHQIDLWSAALGSLPSAAGPLHVLAGDFNATLDQAELRDVLDRGYRDAADAVGAGLTPTWSGNGLLSLPLTIDHVLLDERAGVRDYSTHDLPGSDHRAIFAELALGPEAD